MIIIYEKNKNCYARREIANFISKNNLELIIELHRNSYSKAEANGYETLIDYRQKRVESILNIHEKMVQCGFVDRGIKPVNGNNPIKLYNARIAKEMNVDYALLELGFVSNTKDNSIFDEKIRRIGEIIYKEMEIFGRYKNVGVIYGHGENDPGAVNGERTEREDVRKVEMHEQTEQVHWAYKELENVNTYFAKHGVSGIKETRLNDYMTRGEVITVINSVVEIMKSMKA